MVTNHTRFSSDVAFAFAARVGSAVLLVCFRFFLALFLGPTDQGAYYAFLQGALLFAMIWTLGLGQSAIYFSNKLEHQQKTNAVAIGTYHLSAICALAFGTVFYVLFSAAPWFSVFGIDRGLLPFVLIGAVLLTLYHNGQSILLAIHRNRHYALLAVVATALQIAIFLLLIRSGIQGKEGAILAYCSAMALVSFAGYLITVRTPGVGFSLIGPHVRGRFAFGIQASVAAVLSVLIYRVDFFLLSKMMGESAAGHYSVAEMMSEIVWFIPDAVATILLPRAAGFQPDQQRVAGAGAIRNSLWISLVAVVVMPAVAFAFVTSFGTSYRPSFTPFLVLLPGIWAMSVGKVAFVLLMARKDLKMANFILLLTLAMCGALTAVTVPILGLLGAALSSTIALFLGSTLIVMRFAGLSRSCPSELLIPRKEDFEMYRKFLKGITPPFQRPE